MDTHLLRHIGSFTRNIQSLCDLKYRALNLQKGQFMFLMRVCENPGITQKKLSQLIAVEKSTTTRALQKLEKDGYIRRKKSMKDTRITSVFATLKGLDTYAELARFELELLKSFTKHLSTEEQKVLGSVFDRLDFSHIALSKSENNEPSLTIHLADEKHLNECFSIREIVFQQGQNVAKSIDFDGRDQDADNFIAYYANQPVGTVRLRQIDDSLLKLERLAVLEPYRGLSIGSAIIEYCSIYGKSKGYKKIKLHAQMNALSLYLRAGYTLIGQPFMEADIEHVLVVKSLE